MPGVAQRVHRSRLAIGAALDLDIDRAAAARYGINVGDVQDTIETALAGKATTELWEGERHFCVVVRLPESERALDNCTGLLVAARGAQVPLSQLATLRRSPGAQDIARENGRRVIVHRHFHPKVATWAASSPT